VLFVNKVAHGINWSAVKISLVRLKHFCEWGIFNQIEVNPVSYLVLRVVGAVVSVVTSGSWHEGYGVEVELHCFLNVRLDGDEWSSSFPDLLLCYRRFHLNALETIRISYPRWKLRRFFLAYASCALISTPITLSRFRLHLCYSIRAIDLRIFTCSCAHFSPSPSYVPEKVGVNQKWYSHTK
jgi:hypothetical protein